MRKLLFIAALLMLANPYDGLAGAWNKARDLDVDKQLAGMSMASAILPPGKHENGNMNPKQGTIPGLGLSDAGGTAKGSGAGIGGTHAGLGSPGSGPLPSSGNPGTPPAGDGLNGNANFDTGTGGSGGPGAGVDADLHTESGGTGGVGTGMDTDLSAGTGGGTETTSDLTEEIPTVGGDVSTGGEYLISVDASVGDTEVSADFIPSDSLDNTIIGETTDIGAEIDASGELSGSEVDIGIEADVDGSVSGDDPVDDSADGLSSSSLL